MKLKNALPILLFSALLLNGCSIKKLTTAKLTETLSQQESTVFTGDDDPELIRDALPFTMKLYESLAKADSSNPLLLLATGKLFCLYAQAFVLFPSDTLPDSLATLKKTMRKRAKKLFLRGRNYILQGLELRHPGIEKALRSSQADSALATINEADTSFLYWGAVAWTSAIAADKSDLALALTTRKAVLLMERLLLLNEHFGSGAVHEFFTAYYCAAPKSLGGSEQKAREHFGKSVQLSIGNKASPYVTLASSLCVKMGKKDEFTELLNKALLIDPDSDPSLRLINTIYQQRAAWMLNNTEFFFKGEDKER